MPATSGFIRRLMGPPRPVCTGKDCGRRMSRLKRGFPVFVCRCGLMKVGEHTVTVDGPNNKITWSASGVPTAPGDLGMDTVTGRGQLFVNGLAQPIAVLSDIGVADIRDVFRFSMIHNVGVTGGG